MFRFENLTIWRDSIDYGIRIYKLTNTFPKNELFGLTSQIRRAAISVSSNIAEGSGSTTVADFKKFLDISIKSALETVSQTYFAYKIKYIDENQLKTIYADAEILIKKIRSFKNKL